MFYFTCDRSFTRQKANSPADLSRRHKAQMGREHATPQQQQQQQKPIVINPG